MRSCENKPRREQCIAGQIQLLDPKRISSRERLIGKKEGRGGEGDENAFIFIRVPRKIFWADLPTPPPTTESVSTVRHVQVILIVYNFANESRTILSITTLWKARSIYQVLQGCFRDSKILESLHVDPMFFETNWNTKARSPSCNRYSSTRGVPFTLFPPAPCDGSGARRGGPVGGVAARKPWFVQPEATVTPVVGFVTVDTTRDRRHEASITGR